MRVLIAVLLLLALPLPAAALSCANVPDVTALSPLGCDLGGVTFAGFTVSPSAGFTAALIGTGPSPAPGPDLINLVFQLAPTPGVGPGDVLLSYGVTAPAGRRLIGIDITNDSFVGTTIGEVACRVPFSLGGTCAPADRLAVLVALPGQRVAATFTEPVAFAWLHKDIAVSAGGFISDFSNSHALEPVPEPATLLLVGSSLAGLGWWVRRRRGKAA
jgi:PEP-CTERM motif-containing protein